MPLDQDEVSICDAVRRLSPGIDVQAILSSLRKEAAIRRVRIQKLRRQVLAGAYSIAPGAVAAAMLREGDLGLQ